MDQVKIGKLISKLRKEKFLTQDALGQKLGVNGKAVSKWECGLSMPDISLLNNLSKILGISTEELLDGQQKTLDCNTSFLTKLVYYVKKYFVFEIIIGVLILLVLLLGNYFFNTYNKYSIYALVNSDNEFVVNGYILNYPEKSLIIINKIFNQSAVVGSEDELMIKNLRIYFKAEDKILLNYSIEEQLDDKGNTKLFFMSDVLENFSLIMGENDEFMKKNKYDDFQLVLEYETDNSHETINIDVNVEKV